MKVNGTAVIRGIAYIPTIDTIDTNTNFGWGLWLEVNEDAFNKCLEIYEVDGSNEPPVQGLLANTPPDYKNTNNLKAKIHFGSPDDRPNIILEPNKHKLANEQLNGISIERVHELNKCIS